MRTYKAIRRCVGKLRRPFATVTQKLNCHREGIPGTITCVATRDPVAALTFDDGPHPEYTPRLLDILRQHGAHATFFMIGEVAEKHPQIIQRVAQEGHVIGNHSWDHRFFPSLSGHERREQIRACEEALSPHGERLFRPPYGVQSLASRLDALRLRYKVVTWSLHANDWCEDNSDRMADRLVRGIRPGSIILLHDAIYRSYQAVPRYNREPMLAAVTLFLNQVNRRFRFVTVPDLLRRGWPQWHKREPQDTAIVPPPIT